MQPTAWMNDRGHYGRMDTDTAILYATAPSMLIVWEKVQEPNDAATPANYGSWLLPADIQPAAVIQARHQEEEGAPQPHPTKHPLHCQTSTGLDTDLLLG